MKATKLTNLRVVRVDLVDKGANFDEETGEGAHVLLYKRDSSQDGDDPEPVTREAVCDPKETSMAKKQVKEKTKKSLGAGNGDPTDWDEDEPAHRTSPANVDKDKKPKAKPANPADEEDGADDLEKDEDVEMAADDEDMEDEENEDADDSDEADEEDEDEEDEPAPAPAKSAKKRHVEKGAPVSKAEYVTLQKRLEKAERTAAANAAAVRKLHDEREVRKIEDLCKRDFRVLPGATHGELARILKALHDAAPEETKQLRKLMKGYNEAIEAGALFSEVGASGDSGESDPQAQLDALATQVIEKKEASDLKDAYSIVYKRRPDLYEKTMGRAAGDMRRVAKRSLD